jgi:hypothetical protein
MAGLFPDGVITAPQIQGTYHQLGNAFIPVEKLYVAFASPSGFTPDDIGKRVDWWKLTAGGNLVELELPLSAYLFHDDAYCRICRGDKLLHSISGNLKCPANVALQVQLSEMGLKHKNSLTVKVPLMKRCSAFLTIESPQGSPAVPKVSIKLRQILFLPV